VLINFNLTYGWKFYIKKGDKTREFWSFRRISMKKCLIFAEIRFFTKKYGNFGLKTVILGFLRIYF